MPRTALYDPPNRLQRARVGTLIRTESTACYEVGGQPIAALRMLYHSRTSTGLGVAASGLVMLPGGEPPREGWPVVLYAHGITGIARRCAPSLMRDLRSGGQLASLRAQGWAVVAPDYAGLGTGGPHELGSAAAAATDALSALRAARRAVPELSNEWVIWGHSQGGAAALALAEQIYRNPSPGYQGAVVTAPMCDVRGMAAWAAESPGLGGLVALLAAGAKASDSRLRLDQVLAPRALELADELYEHHLEVVLAAYRDLSGGDLVRPGFLDEPHFARFLDAQVPGRRPVAGPVLLMQGGADTILPAKHTDALAAELSRTGSQVEYRTYPGLGHDTGHGAASGIAQRAQKEIVTWVADRFHGRLAMPYSG